MVGVGEVYRVNCTKQVEKSTKRKEFADLVVNWRPNTNGVIGE